MGLFRIAGDQTVVGGRDRHSRKAQLVAERGSQLLGIGEVLADGLDLALGDERAAQTEAKVDRTLARLARLGQMRQRRQRLFEVGLGFAVRRPVQRACASLRQIMHGLLPYLTPKRMVGETLDLFREPVRIARFDGLDDPCVQRPPALVQQAAVRHFVGEAVPEGVLDFRKQAGLVKELRRLEVRESLLQLVFRLFCDRLQQRERHVHADHGRGLQQVFFQRRQAIDTRRQDGLHGGRNLDPGEGLGQPIASPLTDEDLVSASVRMLSSRKNGLPWVCLIRLCFRGRRCSSAPSSPSSRSSQLEGGSGSMRSCV